MELKARPPVKLEDSMLVSGMGQNAPRASGFPKRFLTENTLVFKDYKRR